MYKIAQNEDTLLDNLIVTGNTAFHNHPDLLSCYISGIYIYLYRDHLQWIHGRFLITLKQYFLLYLTFDLRDYFTSLHLIPTNGYSFLWTVQKEDFKQITNETLKHSIKNLLLMTAITGNYLEQTNTRIQREENY